MSYFKVAFVILVVVSLVLLSFSLNGLIQTGKTSALCSDEHPVVTEYNKTYNGSTTLYTKIVLSNKGSLPLNFLSGPQVIVYFGINKSPTDNYVLQKMVPIKILQGKTGVAYINVTIPSETKVSYFCQVNYYVGNWKPDPYQKDYSYTKYFSGVVFEWEG